MVSDRTIDLIIRAMAICPQVDISFFANTVGFSKTNLSHSKFNLVTEYITYKVNYLYLNFLLH